MSGGFFCIKKMFIKMKLEIYFSKLVKTLQSSTFQNHYLYILLLSKNEILFAVSSQQVAPFGQAVKVPPCVADSFLNHPNHWIFLEKEPLAFGICHGQALQDHQVSHKEYCLFQVLLVQFSIINGWLIPLP